MLRALLSTVQWAAVKMVLLLRIDPPQYGFPVNVSIIPTCQGYSFTSVSTPPTILVTLLAMPHWHPPLGPVVLGAGLGVVSPVGAGLEVVVVISPVMAVVSVGAEEPGSLQVDPFILLFMNAMFSVTLE